MLFYFFEFICQKERKADADFHLKLRFIYNASWNKIVGRICSSFILLIKLIEPAEAEDCASFQTPCVSFTHVIQRWYEFLFVCFLEKKAGWYSELLCTWLSELSVWKSTVTPVRAVVLESFCCSLFMYISRQIFVMRFKNSLKNITLKSCNTSAQSNQYYIYHLVKSRL